MLKYLKSRATRRLLQFKLETRRFLAEIGLYQGRASFRLGLE